MKIGILTHPLENNYGGLLQNFALQKALKDLGHVPITFNYLSYIPFRVKILSVCSRIIKNLRGKKLPLRGWPYEKEQRIISQHTKRFVNNNITTTREVSFNNLTTLKGENVDAIVVGSDQVWRGDRLHVEKMFLSDFTDLRIPKIAYAASFGVDTWNYTSQSGKLCKELVKQFRAISVREDSGVELCLKHFNCDATLVLDPTLLIEPRAYVDIVQKSNVPSIGKNKMMVYVLDKAEYKKQIVSRVSETLSLTPYSVMAKQKFREPGFTSIEECIYPSVEEWLQGFIESDFVVTDSFHGTVFSIIFNKPFIAIINAKRGKSRFTSLLRSLELEYRLVDSVEDAINIINTPIDYKKVNNLLSEKRAESISFLKANLQ